MKAWNHNTNPDILPYFVLHLSDEDADRLLAQLQETIQRRQALIAAARELRTISHTVWVSNAKIDNKPARISFSIAAE